MRFVSEPTPYPLLRSARDLTWDRFYVQAWFWCVLLLVLWFATGMTWYVAVACRPARAASLVRSPPFFESTARVLAQSAGRQSCRVAGRRAAPRARRPACKSVDVRAHGPCARYIMWHEWPAFTALFYLVQATMSIGFGFPHEEVR